MQLHASLLRPACMHASCGPVARGRVVWAELAGAEDAAARARLVDLAKELMKEKLVRAPACPTLAGSREVSMRSKGRAWELVAA